MRRESVVVLTVTLVAALVAIAALMHIVAYLIVRETCGEVMALSTLMVLLVVDALALGYVLLRVAVVVTKGGNGGDGRG